MRRARLALATVLLAAMASATVSMSAAQIAPDASSDRGVPSEAPVGSPASPASAAPDLAATPDAPALEESSITEPPPPEANDEPGIGRGRSSRETVRVGQGLVVGAGEVVREAVVVLGDATIAGQVERDLVVILGTVHLEDTAVIGQSLVVVGGSATAEPGASVGRDLVVIGGALDAPPTFAPGGEHVVVGSGAIGRLLESLMPYVSRGLAWGRVIVPDLPWVWAVVAFFLFVYLVLNLLFDRAVRASAETIATKPLTAFGVGLIVLLLLGPVSLLLAVSVVGLVVVPFLFCAVLAVGVIGKIGVMRWIGMSIVREASPESRLQATRSLAIGSLILVVAYLVPLFGLVAWGLVGVLGLGAASLAFVSAYRSENPAPPMPPPIPLAPTPPPLGPAGYPPSGAAAVAGDEPAGPSTGSADTAEGGVPPLPTGALVAMPRAWFRDRLAAFVLDVILTAIVVNVFELDADDFFLPLLLVYHIGFWAWKQTTVGGIICQLRLVRVDGAPLGFADALVRGLSSIFSLAVLFIGALWILRDPDHQAWHDKIAGTFVVKVPRNWPL